ncbi:hypothetical protein CYY_007821 [Polysphondylium violaceum]|uniref:Homeobox domain-containing protein n=1 Tax=Polysphondylium violaceum TaxID=133409 RepID=A0A8J4PQB0_9MYCE|nr:hypothetical protein CYY_007821 [Polysphondylium violaceum]
MSTIAESTSPETNVSITPTLTTTTPIISPPSPIQESQENKITTSNNTEEIIKDEEDSEVEEEIESTTNTTTIITTPTINTPTTTPNIIEGVTPVGNEDEKEIQLIAKILLNISSNAVVVVPNLSESSPAILTHKLKDSSNLVPFDLASPISSQNDLSASANDISNKKKRQRTSPEQLAILEQIFETDKMPSQQIRTRLANQLGMSSRRVQIWFQNKRAKVKRGGPFGKEDGSEDPFGADDDIMEEDDESMDQENSLTIDDGQTTSSPLNTSSDNIVPSISPVLSSTNGTINNINSSNNNNINLNLTPNILNTISSAANNGGASPALNSFNFHLNQSLSKLQSPPSPPSTVPPSPLSKKIKQQQQQQLLQQQQQSTTSPITQFHQSSFQISNINLGSSSSSLPSFSAIKLNSSSKHIPTNDFSTSTTTTTSNSTTSTPKPINGFSEFHTLKFHNVLKN